MKKWIAKNFLIISTLLPYLALIAYTQHTHEPLYRFLSYDTVFTFYVGLCERFAEYILKRWQH